MEKFPVALKMFYVFLSLNEKVDQLFGLLCGSESKESACIVGDQCSIPGLGRSPGEGNGYTLQDSGLENSMDCKVHEVAKSF